MKNTNFNKVCAIHYTLYAIILSCFILPQAALARDIYVDNQLPNDCPGTYSIANRACSGTDASAYNTPQEAVDIVNPGDVVYFREGTYQDTSTRAAAIFLRITRSGSAGNPITFQNYNGEKVILRGLGFEDHFFDDPGWDGSATQSDEILIYVTADYIHIRGLELTGSLGRGIIIEGSYCLVEECISHDHWHTHIGVGGRTLKDVEGNIIRHVEAYRSRHGGGIAVGPTSTVIDASGQQVIHHYRNNVTENCLIYNNGRHQDLTIVHVAYGDSAGGGNSDAAGYNKNCADFADRPTLPLTMGVGNWARNNVIRGCIGFGNTDDGLDMSFADSIVENNIMFNNGPRGNRGYKLYAAKTFNITFRGNIAFGPNDFNIRGSDHAFYNNLTMFGVNAFSPTAKNNLAELNGRLAVSGDVSNNWEAGVDGDAKLVNVNFMFDNDPYLEKVSHAGMPDTFRLHFSADTSVAQKVAYIKGKIREALSPQTGSPLVDAGTVIEGYHCPYADDDSVNPMDPEAPGRHWRGLAPDIGAYEYVPPSGAFLYGDVSGDREIGAYDAALTAQAAVGLLTLTPEQTQKADVSGDGEVGAYDAALIAQWTVGLISKFPVEN